MPGIAFRTAHKGSTYDEMVSTSLLQIREKAFFGHKPAYIAFSICGLTRTMAQASAIGRTYDAVSQNVYL